MNIFRRFWIKHQHKVAQRENLCQELFNEVNNALNQMDAFLKSSDDFLDYEQGEKINSVTATLSNKLNIQSLKKLKRASFYCDLTLVCDRFLTKRNSYLQEIAHHNNRVARQKLDDAYRLVGKVEGRMLDEQQMLCILKEAHNHLVIAGAGTGKTTTIVGKIKYLLNKGLCLPSEILVLSFTNASASEMRERIQKETGQPIEASTFHKLGLEIIKNYNGTTPIITSIILRTFVKEKLSLLMENPEYLNLLASYLLFHGTPAKSEFDFNSEKEYQDYLECNPPTTFRRESVKSYGELDIANFLAKNGVEYCYEPAYPIDTRTAEYGQYYPDFFLPEYNIYIEYFGINRKGEVPLYFRGKNGKSASEIYKESMDWKKQLHEEHETVMIECFAYDKFSGDLLPLLEKQLIEHGVKFCPISAKALLEELNAGENSLMDGFIELSETVINLIKSNQYNISHVRNMIPSNTDEALSEYKLLNLIEPIFNSYNDILAVNGEIDFNDMINVATQYVSDGKFKHKFKYVIVDEYQDISKGRFSLLKSMREKEDYNLFCVGDDWQSIYRFAGSDIGFILNFNRYWGLAEFSKIETTYRFSQQLVDISGRFVMQNPNQVKKNIRGMDTDASFPIGEINGYTESNLADFLTTRLMDLPQNSSVFFIGRYGFDIDYIRGNSNYICRYDNVSGQTQITFSRRKDLQIIFLTAHRSKGLQADYVFILNNKKSRMGFPSKMQDAPILRLLLEDSDNYPHSEERRLFYVALTRTKKKAILLTLSGKESEFVMELRSVYEDEMKREAFTCPLCGGRLVKRAGKYGEFFGCSNYKNRGCSYTRNINTKASLLRHIK